MADFVGIDVTGDKELMRALDRLGDRAHRRAAKKAIRAGYLPMKRAMRARVPRGKTKNLYKSIGKKEKVYAGTFLIIVGPRIIMGQASGQHGYLIEFGTDPRYAETYKGQPLETPAYRGVGPALHPFEQAYDATKAEALAKSVERLHKEVLIEAEKAGRGG
jgi:HK97 gp10 family phage protein